MIGEGLEIMALGIAGVFAVLALLAAVVALMGVLARRGMGSRKEGPGAPSAADQGR